MNCLCLSWTPINPPPSWGHSDHIPYPENFKFNSHGSLFQIRFEAWMGIYWLTGIPHWKLLRRNQGLLTRRSLFMCLGHFFFMAVMIVMTIIIIWRRRSDAKSQEKHGTWIVHVVWSVSMTWTTWCACILSRVQTRRLFQRGKIESLLTADWWCLFA